MRKIVLMALLATVLAGCKEEERATYVIDELPASAQAEVVAERNALREHHREINRINAAAARACSEGRRGEADAGFAKAHGMLIDSGNGSAPRCGNDGNMVHSKRQRGGL